MKKNLNIIQINGTRGILIVIGIVCCLAAGFIYFPGWVAMHIWNFISAYVEQMPAIGIIQGILLWGIAAASYFIFRKEKLVVCMRASEGLSEDELKKVFADIRERAENDTLIQSMIKARQAELRIKNLSENNVPMQATGEQKELSSENISDKPAEHIQTK